MFHSAVFTAPPRATRPGDVQRRVMPTVNLTDAETALCAELAAETGLPPLLVSRFRQMWVTREAPFFAAVSEETDTLACAALAELVRSVARVASEVVSGSMARVMCGAAGAVDFEGFVRGYGRMHARTLRDALPFAFAVFDLDGDGKLAPGEFREVLEATLALQALDGTAISRVLAAPPPGEGIDGGLTRDQFRYFASLSAETILGCCGFMMHVRDFYVPLSPLGPEAEEAEEAEAAAARRREHGERERVAVATAARPDVEARKAAAAAAAKAAGDEEVAAAVEVFGVEFVEALEACKSTPEERAARCKDQGNALLGERPGGPAKAAAKYTEGLDEGGRDAALNAALLCNRAAAELMQYNWGRALADATAALALEALPPEAELKACSRGARAAVKIEKPDEALELCARAAGVQPAGGRSAVVDGELQAAEKAARAAVAARAERRKAEAAAAAERKALEAALAARGVALEPWEDEAMADAYVGPSSGARVWYDAAADCVHWPVLLLYPETAQSDFIQDVGDDEALAPHLEEMFGAAGENAPGWDAERKYRSGDLRLYAACKRDGKEVAERVRAEKPLLPQLVALQPKGHAVRGIPMIHVLVGGSPYEGEFLKRMKS